MAVFCMNAPSQTGWRVKQFNSRHCKFRHHVLALLLPISTLVQEDEVISAHMTHEIRQRIAMGYSQFGDQANHLITPPVSILVIEGLEVVEIGIAGDKIDATLKQPLNVVTDRDVSWQKSQRIGMPGWS